MRAGPSLFMRRPVRGFPSTTVFFRSLGCGRVENFAVAREAGVWRVSRVHSRKDANSAGGGDNLDFNVQAVVDSGHGDAISGRRISGEELAVDRVHFILDLQRRYVHIRP